MNQLMSEAKNRVSRLTLAQKFTIVMAIFIIFNHAMHLFVRPYFDTSLPKASMILSRWLVAVKLSVLLMIISYLFGKFWSEPRGIWRWVKLVFLSIGGGPLLILSIYSMLVAYVAFDGNCQFVKQFYRCDFNYAFSSNIIYLILTNWTYAFLGIWGFFAGSYRLSNYLNHQDLDFWKG